MGAQMQKRTCCLLAIMGCAATSAMAPAQRYRLIEVGTLPGHGNSFPSAVNDRGQVLAYALATPTRTAFVWTDGEIRTLPFLNQQEPSAIPNDLNNNGDAVGWSAMSFNGHAVLWPAEGGVVDLDPPGANDSFANALNDSRLVVGFARNWRTFLWEDGKWRTFVDIGWRSMNNAGQMVGDAGVNAFLWDNGEVVQLPPLRPGGNTSANEVSPSGLIAGASALNADHAMPVMWENRRLIALGVLDSGGGGTGSGVNDAGEVVGALSIPDGMFRLNVGFVWRNHIMHNLNDLLLDEANNEWLVIWGIDINASGQLTAEAYARSRDLRLAVRLDPVDEGLMVWSFAPNQPGALNTLEVIHATPHGRVVFVVGTARGEGRSAPQCPGATIELVNPQVIGFAIADADGRATLDRFIPAGLAGRRFVVQAIDWSTCKTSPPGFIQIQP